MRASNLFEEDAILEIIEYGTFPKCSFPEYQQLPYLRTGKDIQPQQHSPPKKTLNQKVGISNREAVWLVSDDPGEGDCVVERSVLEAPEKLTVIYEELAGVVVAFEGAGIYE
jgi:hypothetical protein